MKNKQIVFLIAILLLISAVLISVSVVTASNKEQLRKTMINNTFSEFRTISLTLEELLNNIENGVTSYEANQQRLIMLSCDFTALHSTLKWYANVFSSLGSYTGIIDFEHLAYTLTAGTGMANDFCYSGILMDGTISENEVKYLTLLKSDIDIILQSMASDENSLQERQNLSPSEIDKILDTFFSTWSYHNENSPYFLLRSN